MTAAIERQLDEIEARLDIEEVRWLVAQVRAERQRRMDVGRRAEAEITRLQGQVREEIDTLVRQVKCLACLAAIAAYVNGKRDT